MMTRKDFIAIAEALSITSASTETVEAIATVCKISNRHFDRERFIVAATKGEYA